MADSKKYDGGQWEHSLRKMTTATSVIEPTIYTDGTAITSYTIKGNTVQNGTPTPSNPVPVVGVGELETTGEHSGEYKIPISSGGVTTNAYLGEVQSTRKIEKKVLTGQESWQNNFGTSLFGTAISRTTITGVTALATNYTYNPIQSGLNAGLSNGEFALQVSSSFVGLYIKDERYTTVEAWKQFLADQYAAGTPVTLWYVLETETTGIVNEPLMKIGTYADTLSNATSIPTTEGANSITVDTTVQPSEFTATWTGWHDSSVKEWDGSDWQ